MNRLELGGTGITVSEYCLGSMTWGSQTSQSEAHAQIDRALERGVDFIDTAEMYPVNPVAKETVGQTESVIGAWIAQTGRRNNIVLATKCSGFNDRFVREGQPISGATIRAALDGSLKRLNTDYVDLYQMHWPNRGSFHFRQIWGFDPSGQNTQETLDHMAEIMDTARALVTEGKIRAFGLSNDSVWGTMKWLDAAQASGGPRVATMQNEYSLLCRQYDSDLAEMAHHENITLLAFSPMAAGLLTGKYQKGDIPTGSRMSLNAELGGRKTDRAFTAVDAYIGVAEKHGLNPVHMALAWTRSRPFRTIPIFGATTLQQLDTALAGLDVTLGAEVLSDIADAHKAHPMPY